MPLIWQPKQNFGVVIENLRVLLIFTALVIPRSDGQTSDFFKDPKKLEYDTEIYEISS
jgi:hypothetical protein